MRAVEPEAIVLEHKRDIVERSDVDRHDPRALRELLLDEETHEDWGDGWYVNAEPVLVERGASGEIVRTTALSEVMPTDEQVAEGEPIQGRTRVTPTPLNAADRDKVVFILASKLFKWYASQPPHPSRYNPIHDGIPDLPAHSPQNLQPMPGTNLFPATPGQVMEWLKGVIGKRAEVQNRKIGRDTYRPSLTIKRSSV
jgi:hypothetical protein